MSQLERFYSIIQKPVLSEKATYDTSGRNAYHFRVPIDANKIEIKNAIQSLFGVTVLDVNTLVIRGKFKRMGCGHAKLRNWKKAIITLKQGDEIKFFDEKAE